MPCRQWFWAERGRVSSCSCCQGTWGEEQRASASSMQALPQEQALNNFEQRKASLVQLSSHLPVAFFIQLSEKTTDFFSIFFFFEKEVYSTPLLLSHQARISRLQW